MKKFTIEISSESRATEEQTADIIRRFLFEQFLYQKHGEWTANFKIFEDGQEL